MTFPHYEFEFIYPTAHVEQLAIRLRARWPGTRMAYWDWGYEGAVAVVFVRCWSPTSRAQMFLKLGDPHYINL